MIEARPDQLKPKALQEMILQRVISLEGNLDIVAGDLQQIGVVMARLVEVAAEVRDAVNARFDRETARLEQAIAAKQAQLDALVASEDAEDVIQNAEIARLQAEIDAQTEAVQILEGIKSGAESDLNGNGGMVIPEPVAEPVPADTATPAEDVTVDQPVIVEGQQNS